MTRSRCQRSTVSGRTSNLTLRSTSDGIRCGNAAKNARRGEPHPVFAELTLKRRDLMARRGSPRPGLGRSSVTGRPWQTLRVTVR